MEKYSHVSKLDPKYQFNPEEVWIKLVNLFKESFQNRDLFNLKKSISQLQHYSTVMDEYFDISTNLTENLLNRRKIYDMILGPLFDFTTTFPFIDISSQTQSAILFNSLSKYDIFKSNLTLSLKKAQQFYDELFNQSRYAVKRIKFSQPEIFLDFFSCASFYFDDSESDFLLDKYIDRFGFSTLSSTKCVYTLLRFYPSTIESFDKIINYLTPFLKNPVSSNITSAILRYLYKSYRSFKHNKFFDWKPYIKPLFNSITNDFINSEKIIGKSFNLNKMKFKNSCPVGNDYDRGALSSNFSLFLSYLLIEYDEEKNNETTVCSTVLSSLKDFVNIFISMINSKSDKAKEAVKFITKMITYFYLVNKSLREKKKANFDYVKNQNISEQTIQQFVTIVLPLIETTLFNAPKLLRNHAYKVVPRLAEFSYEKTVNELLPFCMKNMVDSELTYMAITCFSVIKILIPSLLNEKRIDENLSKIPQIIDASLEFCKNSSLQNYNLGITVLSEIAQFISVPNENVLTTKFSMKKRMVANAMINSLQIIINCHFEHNKPFTADYADNPYNNMLTGASSNSVDTPVNTKNSDKGPLEKSFICYFNAFDDSYIESIVIPKVLEKLKDSSDATHLNSFTYKFTKYLTKAKPDLISKILSPKLEELFIKSNLKRKFFWAHLLASSFISCPTFSEKIPHYVELIQNLLNIKNIDQKKDEKNDDDDECQCYLKCAHVLCGELLGKIPGPNIIDWSNTEDSDDKLQWGKLYLSDEVHPKWYEIDQQIINFAADSIFKSLQPLLEKFPSLEIKKQKKITKIIISFILMLSVRGKPGRIDFYDFNDNETLLNIEKSILDFINKMLSTIESYQSQALILALVASIFDEKSKLYVKMEQTCKNILCLNSNFIGSEIGYESTRFYSLFTYFYEITSCLYNYSYEINPRIEILIDNIYKLTESEYSKINVISQIIIEKFTFQNESLFDKYFLQKISVLENPNKTKDQFKTSIAYLCKLAPPILFKKQELVIKLIRTIISVKFEKEWEIDLYLKTIFSYFNIFYFYTDIKETKEWCDLNNDIVNIQRTVDSCYFFDIIQFMISQKTPPSIGLVQYLIKSLHEANKLHFETVSELTYLMYKMKPIAPKSEFKTIEEFVEKYPSIIPYVDKIATGFYYKSNHYTLCTGESVFVNDQYEELRNYLINQVFANEKIFHDIFKTFALVHPKESKPDFNFSAYYFWKLLVQLMKSSIVKYTKSLILDVVKSIENKSDVQPVHVACVAELIAGISRASKHWSTEERKCVIDEILIPSCTTLITVKGSNNIIIDMATVITLNWDYRRNYWLYEIVEKEFVKIKENMNENVLKNLLVFALIIYRNACASFNKEFIRIMREIVIPIFDDLKKFKIEIISSLAQLLFCRITFTKVYEHNETESSPESKISKEIASLFFTDIFDKQKEEAPERVAIILVNLFNQNSAYLSYCQLFIIERFQDICVIDRKLIDIQGGKFSPISKDILMNTGLLQYQNLGININDFLFENIFKIKESIPWNSRLNLVGFLHVLTLSHIFLLSRDEFIKIFDDVLNFYLQDSNQEVRKAARSLIKVFICVVYSDSKELCIEKVNEYLQIYFKEKGKSKKNLFTAVEFASALLANVSIWFSGCPDWLPNIFDSLERIYRRGDCKEEIKEALNDFFTRHEGREINEVEEYKYVLTGGYLA